MGATSQPEVPLESEATSQSEVPPESEAPTETQSQPEVDDDDEDAEDADEEADESAERFQELVGCIHQMYELLQLDQQDQDPRYAIQSTGGRRLSASISAVVQSADITPQVIADAEAHLEHLSARVDMATAISDAEE